MNQSNRAFERVKGRMRLKALRQGDGRIEHIESFSKGFNKGWKECEKALKRRFDCNACAIQHIEETSKLKKEIEALLR